MIRIIGSLFTTALLTNPRGALLPILVAATMTASSVVHADPIVGGWGLFDATGAGAVNLLPDGQYMHIQFGPPVGGGHPGIERGTYAWNATNGSFLNQAGLDTNGEWGLSDHPCQPASGCVVTASNGVLHALNPNDSQPDTTLFSVRAWYLEGIPDPGDLIVFDLFSNGSYLLGIDPPATGYYVYGFYDSLTGALTPQATDLPGGLTGPDHASFSGNNLILTGVNGQVTLRAIPEPAGILLVGLGLLCLVAMRRERRSIPGKA